jgi:hypothetical protein
MIQNEFNFEYEEMADESKLYTRRTDPDTSRKAAIRIAKANPKRFKAGCKKALLLAEYGADNGDGFTDCEAAKMVNANDSRGGFEGTRRRCSDLRREGFIMDTDKRRKNEGVDDESMVCVITWKGTQALKCLQETGYSSPKE